MTKEELKSDNLKYSIAVGGVRTIIWLILGCIAENVLHPDSISKQFFIGFVLFMIAWNLIGIPMKYKHLQSTNNKDE